MDPRTLLLRKNDVDTTLVKPADAGSGHQNPTTFRLGLRVLSGAKRAVKFVENESIDWPERTDTLCWHCCHPFDTQPLPMPYAYDDRRDIFHVKGCFCSWACIKTYNSSDSSYLKHARAMLITLFRKRSTGVLGRLVDGKLVDHIVPAPPREMLRAFGGTLTIEEFRATSDDGKIYRFMPPNLVLHDPLLEKIGVSAKPHVDLKAALTFGKTTQKNETLRLKRSKPLAHNNMLERTMGLTIS